MLVLLAAAMPVRLKVSVPVINSVDLLDILLLGAALTLLIDCAYRPVDVGYRRLFALLCVPLGVCVLSLLWSQDKAATVRAALVYGEGVIAYLFVVRELNGASPDRVMIYIRRYTLLLIVPAVLLLLHVPGFGPEAPGLKPSSGDFLSYYSRLSHPVLGRSNNLATLLAFFVPILLYWGHRHRDTRCTWTGVIGLIAIACTLSRGVGLAFIATGLLAAGGSALRHRGVDSRTLGKAAVIGTALVAGIVLLYQFNPDSQKFFNGRLSLHNVTLRSDYAGIAIHKIAVRPLLGYGGGVTPDHEVSLTGGVHNTYLQQVIYYGPLLALVVSVCMVGIPLFFFSRAGRIGVARAIGFALVVQLLTFLVESSFEGTVLRVLFYFSVGLAAALARACEAREPMDSPGSALAWATPDLRA